MRTESRSLPRPNDFKNLGLFISDGSLPPSVDSLYTVNENKVSSPRIMRFTSTMCASKKSLQKSLGIPLALIYQPLAEQQPNDSKIPLIEREPYRCAKCLAYLSPFMCFEYDYWLCGVCKTKQRLPSEYINSIPEKSLGTYEYCLSGNSINDENPVFFFCLERTKESFENGMFQHVLLSIKCLLDYMQFPDKTSIGILVFHSAVYYYKKGTNNYTEIVVNDWEDLFMPEPLSLLTFNLLSQKSEIFSLIDFILSSSPLEEESSKMIPIDILLKILQNSYFKNSGGRMILSICNKMSINPSINFEIIANDYIMKSVCIDIYLVESEVSNVKSFCDLCEATGGDFYFYPHYDKNVATILYYKLARSLLRNQGFQASIQIFYSKGLKIKKIIGKWRKQISNAELKISAIDCDKTFVIFFTQNETLTHTEYIQCVLTYNDRSGQRIMRVSNSLIVPTKSVYYALLNSDTDACIHVWLKKYSLKALEKTSNKIIDCFTNLLVKAINLHRTFYKSKDVPGMLLPNKLKYLPLFINSAMKLPPFTYTFRNISANLLLAWAHNIKGLSVIQTRFMIYPSCANISDFGDFDFKSPRSIDSLSTTSVILFFNGEIILIFIGSNVEPFIIQNLFGIGLEELKENADTWELAPLETPESRKLHNIISLIQAGNMNRDIPITLFFEGASNDWLLRSMLTEDRIGQIPDYQEYIDYLNTPSNLPNPIFK
ncbi:unnamed protein product [Blepharisma stoltei]|uniref:Uncharacterized protein n=1 Tax=Blepharisma stoltei TaxID=1481888 RepID=A0AAU9K9Q7_9CILI|nr:unnamed protein product [Blepharisma stoltei]